MHSDRFAGDPMAPGRRRLESLVEGGLVAGVVSAGATAVVLALGGIVVGIGPWTPFYAIVALVDPAALDTARSRLDQGIAVPFFQQEFVGGLGVCLFLGAVSGVVFALGTRRHHIRGWLRYVLGLAHGVLMMSFFYLGVLQTLGILAGLEADAMSLSRVLGWPALVLAHAVHGLVLAWVFRTRLVVPENVFGRRVEDPSVPRA